MQTPGPGTASGRPVLDDQAVSYLKLLKTLRNAGQYRAADRDETGDTPGSTDLGVVERIAAWIESGPVLHYICLTPRWYDDWGIKEALVRNEHTPEVYRTELEKQISIFDLMRELDSPQLSDQERAEIREDVRSLFTGLALYDRRVVKQRAYSLSSSRRGDAPETGEVDTREFAAAEVAEAELARLESLVEVTIEAVEVAAEPVTESDTEILPEVTAEPVDTQAVEAEEVEEEQRAKAALVDTETIEPEQIPNLPLQQKVALAEQARRPEILGVLAHEFHDAVQLALVRNPALTEDVAGILARRATARVASEIYRNKTLFHKQRVRQGLMNCPNAPPAAQLEIVGTIGSLDGLIKVLGSPKVKALEVKSKARSRLTERFRSLSLQEKVAAVRKGGRLLLKELWGDFFRNEELVLKCLQEKQLDEGTVLEIARNKIAPRRALEAIGNNPAWTSNYQIVLALVFNPKTPRGVVTKLVRKLNPADRRRVKNNPSLPQFVRRLA